MAPTGLLNLSNELLLEVSTYLTPQNNLINSENRRHESDLKQCQHNMMSFSLACKRLYGIAFMLKSSFAVAQFMKKPKKDRRRELAGLNGSIGLSELADDAQYPPQDLRYLEMDLSHPQRTPGKPLRKINQKLSNASRLQMLEVRIAHERQLDALFPAITALKGLKTLTLDTSQWDQEDYGEDPSLPFAAILKMESLRSLKIDASAEKLFSWKEMPLNCSNIEFLEVSTEDDDWEIETMLPNLLWAIKSLKSLTWNNYIWWKASEAFFAINRQANFLRTLRIRETRGTNFAHPEFRDLSVLGALQIPFASMFNYYHDDDDHRLEMLELPRSLCTLSIALPSDHLQDELPFALKVAQIIIGEKSAIQEDEWKEVVLEQVFPSVISSYDHDFSEDQTVLVKMAYDFDLPELRHIEIRIDRRGRIRTGSWKIEGRFRTVDLTVVDCGGWL